MPQYRSIIAVHGLGANPDWAWTRKKAGKTGGEEILVNWLKDENMLPSKMPNAQIMTFNYESKWHKDAPRQRRLLCADQLLTALDNQRKQASATFHAILFSATRISVLLSQSETWFETGLRVREKRLV